MSFSSQIQEALPSYFLKELVKLIIEYAKGQIIQGTHLRHFDVFKPSGMATDGKNLFVSSLYSIRVYDPRTCTLLTEFGRRGASDGEFDLVYHLSYDYEDHQLYVADLNNKRIQVLRVSQSTQHHLIFKRTLPLPFHPSGVVIWNNFCVVADYYAHNLVLYSKTGEFVGRWGAVSIRHPEGLYGIDNELYVASGEGAVYVLDEKGKLLKAIKVAEPVYSVIPCGDKVYAGADSCVWVCSRESGQSIGQITKSGTEGESVVPMCGMVMIGEEMFVGNAANRRVDVVY